MARTVGLPRLSKISRPNNLSILGMSLDEFNKLRDQVTYTGWRTLHELQHDIPLPRLLHGRQIFKPRFPRHPGKQTAQGMTHCPRLQRIPAQPRNCLEINSPEQVRILGKMLPLPAQMIRFTKKMCERESDVKS